MGFRLGVRRYAIDRGSTSPGISFRYLSEISRASAKSLRGTPFQLSSQYVTQSGSPTRDLPSKDRSGANIRRSTGELGPAEKPAAVKSMTFTSTTAPADHRLNGVGNNDSSFKQPDWLSWDFDASFPPQVRLCGWGLKVIDIVNGVTESDATKLQASLERYTRVLPPVEKMPNNEQRLRAELDLIQDFKEIWYRSEERLRATLQETNEKALSAPDSDLRKEVFAVLRQLDTSILNDQALSHNVESENLAKTGSLNEVEDTSDGLLGADSNMDRSDQRDLYAGFRPPVQSIQEQPTATDQTDINIAIDSEAAETPTTVAAPFGSSGHLERFVPETTREWLRTQQRKKAEAKAELDAQTKCT